MLEQLAAGVELCDIKRNPPQKLSEKDAKRIAAKNVYTGPVGDVLFDKRIPGQEFALFSYIPAVASARDKGYAGFAKIRGIYPTAEIADEAAIDLIRTSDQVSSIQIVPVGRPFPIMENTDLPPQFVKNVDPNHSISESHKQAVKKQQEEEQKMVRERDERAKEVLAGNEAPPTEQSEYMRTRLALLQQVSVFVQVRQNIIRHHAKRLAADAISPDLNTNWIEDMTRDLEKYSDQDPEKMMLRKQLMFDYESLVGDLLKDVKIEDKEEAIEEVIEEVIEDEQEEVAEKNC